MKDIRSKINSLNIKETDKKQIDKMIIDKIIETEHFYRIRIKELEKSLQTIKMIVNADNFDFYELSKLVNKY